MPWFLLYSLSTVCRWTLSMTNSALSKAYIPWMSPVFKAAMASFENEVRLFQSVVLFVHPLQGRF